VQDRNLSIFSEFVVEYPKHTNESLLMLHAGFLLGNTTFYVYGILGVQKFGFFKNLFFMMQV